MGKKLAIKGHPTRYKEVVEILKMLGGTECGYSGKGDSYYYYINEYSDSIVGTTELNKPNNYKVFTLEEFLEKYPFKVRDFVRIPEYESELCILKMKWCPLSEHIEYMVWPNDEEEWFTANELLEYNDNPSPSEITRSERMIERNNTTNHMQNVLAELLDHIKNTSKEELEKEFKELEEWSNVGPTVEEFMDFCNKVIKKPKYPKTYEECCEIVKACPTVSISYDSDEDMLYNDEVDLTLLTLRKLLICRNAYWKIAGEEMGLGKPWEPRDAKDKYVIRRVGNTILKGYSISCVLEFPTEEMRDAFFENFKDLIEQCKELL